MKKYLISLLVLSFSVMAQDSDLAYVMGENGLRAFPIDNIGNNQFFSNHKFVRVDEGRLFIETSGKSTNKTSLTFGDIQYIGTNKGEWGGTLEVIINGVSTDLMKGNIVHLLPIDKKLYVIEGLAHLSMSGGSISVIEDLYNPTEPRLITLLPDAPSLVYLDQTRPDFQPIIIVGFRSVMELNPFNQLNILHWDGFWSYKFSPTSITRYKDNYLIGLPFGVAAIPAPEGSQNIVFYAEPEFNKANH